MTYMRQAESVVFGASRRLPRRGGLGVGAVERVVGIR